MSYEVDGFYCQEKESSAQIKGQNGTSVNSALPQEPVDGWH